MSLNKSQNVRWDYPQQDGRSRIPWVRREGIRGDLWEVPPCARGCRLKERYEARTLKSFIGGRSRPTKTAPPTSPQVTCES